MNKSVEILLTVLALAGMYCAIPKSTAQVDSVTRAEQTIMLADGTDPMPFCRAKGCSPK
jgi:hypothetical protein